MDKEQLRARMAEFMKPLSQHILMCDDQADILMLASCFLVVTKDILDRHVGVAERKLLFKQFT